ncbi:MAG: hypothetical protein QNJ98_09690 [Planctomycetota bacterium]|nr:hypothetical protein [Planctomycetota bacterium]
MSTHDSIPTKNRAATRFGRVAALVLSIGLVAPTAYAGPEAEGQVAKADDTAVTTPGEAEAPQMIELSPFELAQLLRSRFAAYTIAPRATDRESAVRSAWSAGLKNRARRMLSRIQRVAEAKRWDARSTDIADWAPTDESMTSMLRELSAIYVDLAAAEKRLAKARIVEKDVLYFGTLPGRKGRQPTQELQLSGVQSELGVYGGLSFGGGGISGSIGAHYKGKTRRVKIKVFDREVEQRMKDAQQAKIDAQVAAIRANIDAYTNSVKRDRDLVRALAESVQLGEELRLAQQITGLENADERREASVLLAQMRIARVDGRGLFFASATKYSQTLRRGWMQKRAKLVDLLDQA